MVKSLNMLSGGTGDGSVKVLEFKSLKIGFRVVMSGLHVSSQENCLAMQFFWFQPQQQLARSRQTVRRALIRHFE